VKIENFFAELKRRNVYKVAVAYAVVAWLLIQAASIFFPVFDAPPWVMKIFIIVITNADLGMNYYYARGYDEAITQLRKTLEMDPGYYYAHVDLGQVLAAKRAFGDAISEYQKARALNDAPFVLGLLGHAYASSGNKTEALKILDQLKELSSQRYVSMYSFAIVYLALDDKQEAFRSLEQSYQDRAGADIGWIRVDSLLDPLHGDPGFEALAEKIIPAREFAKASTTSK